MDRLVLVFALLWLPACQRHRPQPTKMPPPQAIAPAVAPIGVPACDDYLRRVAACQKLSPAAREVFAAGAGAWKAAGTAATKSCEGAAKAAAAELAALGC